jgi:hypothetical protein
VSADLKKRRGISHFLELLNTSIEGRCSQEPYDSAKSIEDCLVSGDVKREKVELRTCFEIQFSDPYIFMP